jgi:hypothetical protein
MKFSKIFFLIGTVFILLAACGPDEQVMETNASDQPGQIQVLPSPTPTSTLSSSTQSPTLSAATATSVGELITPTVPPVFTPTSSIDALVMPGNKLTKLNAGLGNGKITLEFYSDRQFAPGSYYATVTSGDISARQGPPCRILLNDPKPDTSGNDPKIVMCKVDSDGFSSDVGTEYKVKLYYDVPGTGTDFQVGNQEIKFKIAKSGVVAGAPSESGTTDSPGDTTTNPPDTGPDTNPPDTGPDS